jgi:Acyl-CoA dehydrogenase, N-terminal domain
MEPATSEGIDAVRDMVNRFMQTEVVPVMDEYEKRGEFPRALISKAGEAGRYGAVFPESVGGTNLGYFAATVIQEEMARNDVRFASCNNQQGSTCPSCIYFGGTRAGQGEPGVLAEVLRRSLLHRRGLRERAEDSHCRGRPRLQDRGSPPRQDRLARHPPERRGGRDELNSAR